MLTASGTEENLLAAIRGGAAGLPAEERAAGADRRVPARRRARRGRALGRGRAAPARAGARGRPPAAASRTRSRPRSAPASSRCCSCSTSISAPTRSPQRLYISEHTVRSHVKSLLAQARRLLAPRGAGRARNGPRRLATQNPPPWGMRFTHDSEAARARYSERHHSLSVGARWLVLPRQERPAHRAGRCHSRNPSSAAPTSAGSVRGS